MEKNEVLIYVTEDGRSSAYLDIAELRAMNREPMYMKDWLETIDDYLKMTRRDILYCTPITFSA